MSKTIMIKILNRFLANGLFCFLNSKRERDFPTGNIQMFQEDVSKHKMPYRKRLEKFPDFKIMISGSGKELAIKVLKSLSEHKHRSSDTELLCDFINNVSQSVYYYGKMYISNRVGENQSSIFIKIYPHNVFRFFKFYLQYIPKSDRRNKTVFFRYERAEYIFCFSVFKNPFSRLKFKIIKRLLSLSDQLNPNFVLEDKFQNKDFEMTTYNQLRIQFISLITKDYAWNLRSLVDEQTNEYFKIYSAYKFAIKSADDRKLLLDQVNKMFRHFKIDASVTLVGIPTSEDLKKSLSQLKSGEKSFRKAIDEVYLI